MFFLPSFVQGGVGAQRTGWSGRRTHHRSVRNLTAWASMRQWKSFAPWPFAISPHLSFVLFPLQPLHTRFQPLHIIAQHIHLLHKCLDLRTIR